MKAAIGSLIGLVLSISVSAEPLIEGRVRLDSGGPVADAQVRLFDLSDLQRGAIARALTDGTGYFALPLAVLTSSALPARFALGPNYPNPFNPSTIIPYQLAALSQVRLEVFNLLGQRIATLVDEERPAGFHTAAWNATDGAGRAVGAGVYIYRMTVGAASQTGRMVLIDGQAGVSATGAASDWVGASGGGSAGEQVYGLIVSGEGLAPYVDSSFRVEAGMAPVEVVVSARSGKAADDDCALCDLFDALHDDDEGPAPSGKALAGLAAPTEPTNLRVEAVTDSSARVRWDAVEGATDYDVNYRPAQGGRWTNWPHPGTGLFNTITGLTPKTAYRWAVRAENSDGHSDWVFGTNFTTLPDNQEGEDDTPEEMPGDAPFSIPDAKLRAAIAKELRKASGATITKDDMTRFTHLNRVGGGSGCCVRDLTGLEFATNLTHLWLGQNEISDLSPLRGLTNLKQLAMHKNEISDLSPLLGLTNLKTLNFSSNRIRDISPLLGLTNLTYLNLSNNRIRDISPLLGLTNLTYLNIGGLNLLSDLSPLLGLTNLEWLDISYSTIYESDLSLLSGLPNLTHLGTKNIYIVPTLDLDDFEKGDFDIELVFLSSFSEHEEQVIRYAARRWESIIREDLPDYTFTEGYSGGCSDLSYEIPSGEQIDDLRIYVISDEDYPETDWDGVAGEAWVRATRETSHLSLVGCMAFKTSDSYGLSLSTALHEIGHVLGIGTIMGYSGFLQEIEEGEWDPVTEKWVVVKPAGDVHFNGPLAIAAFDDAGGHNYTGKKVPMEEDWGHWRASVLAGELMSPSSWPGTVSAITIQALADLGWSVDVTQADPYTLPSAAAKVVAAGSTPERTCGFGHRKRPIDVVDEHGRVVRTLHR